MECRLGLAGRRRKRNLVLECWVLNTLGTSRERSQRHLDRIPTFWVRAENMQMESLADG